jgi:molecular chaperone HtpG
VDAEVADKLIEKDEQRTSKLSTEQKDELRPVFKAHVQPSYAVTFENLSEDEMPILITQAEFMRRMKEMASLNAGMGFYGNLPDSYNLVVNANHPLVGKIAKDVETAKGAELASLNQALKPLNERADELKKAKAGKKDEEIPQADKEKLEDLEKQIDEITTKKNDMLASFGKDNKVVKQLIDLALLSHNMLKGEDLHTFVMRSVDLIKM